MNINDIKVGDTVVFKHYHCNEYVGKEIGIIKSLGKNPNVAYIIRANTKDEFGISFSMIISKLEEEIIHCSTQTKNWIEKGHKETLIDRAEPKNYKYDITITDYSIERQGGAKIRASIGGFAGNDGSYFKFDNLPFPLDWPGEVGKSYILEIKEKQ